MITPWFSLVLLVFGPEDLQRYAVPIGVGLGLVVMLAVPSLRGSVMRAYEQGKQAGERLREPRRPDNGM